METPKVYVLCDANCKWESLTKEQILTAITQAVSEGTISDIDTGFVQTIKTINGHALKFFVGEQSEYEALTDADKKDLFAIITNDTTKDGLINVISTLEADFNEVMDGNRPVPRATNATKAKQLNIGAPVLNSTKIITENGYYYVRFYSGVSDVYDAVIYWDGNSIKKTLYTSVDQNWISTTYLVVSSGGKVSIRNAERWFTDGTYEDKVLTTSLYIAKIGE